MLEEKLDTTLVEHLKTAQIQLTESHIQQIIEGQRNAIELQAKDNKGNRWLVIAIALILAALAGIVLFCSEMMPIPFSEF